MLRSFADGQLFGAAHGVTPASVLALPGWARTHRDFDATLEGLDAIAVDLPGFGASPEPPEAWGGAGYAEAVAPVLDEMARPAVVVGHSFGGRVAVHLALLRPERVAALVLTGVPLLRRPGSSPAKAALAYRAARALHRRGLVGERAMGALRERYGSADYRAAKGIMRQVLVRVVNETYEEQLAAVACPVELVWGEDDAEVPVTVAEAASRLLADASLTVVPGAGHMVPQRAPAELRDAVTRHLRSRL
ncbi:MAG: alpha/beta hydrolase [Actinomycetota bacterium]|nr:alpha/beta hydrolase [Actinomycetota bacterium]MDQ3680965.1 alpha/beta hydrolase [Actinomycetota bacterium]